MEQILREYDLSKWILIAKIILNKDPKLSVCKLDSDTGFFNIVVGVMQVDRLSSYLSIILEDYTLKAMLINTLGGYRL